MTSSNLNNGSQYKVDGIWPDPSGDILIEIKRTNNVRDIRSALLELAYSLTDAPDSARAICVLTQSRLSPKRLNEELERFRCLVRREVGERIDLTHFEDIERGQRSLNIGNTQDFILWLANLIASEVTGSRFSRQMVTSALALLWLRGAGPMTTKSLQEKCGVSYPTVAASISEWLKLDLIEQQSDRRVSLRYLPVDRWVQTAHKHMEGRKVHRYVDPTGQMRTPEALMSRLFSLQQQGIARQVGVGGVLGARRYFPDLDITASPRLDLSVYGGGNLDFVQRLDAALVPAKDSRAKAHVVVHVTAEPESFLDRDSNGSWASEMECSADLIELGLIREVQEMFETLRQQRGTSKLDDEKL